MADNALMQRSQGPGPQPPTPTNDTPEMELERLMRETGYTGNDPAAGMKHVWEKMPTDEVAETIEAVAKRQGLPTPWSATTGGAKMKLGGPMEAQEGSDTDDGQDIEMPRRRAPSRVRSSPLAGVRNALMGLRR
jgi:hypothetical protein